MIQILIALAKHVLLHPHQLEWTIQGFGMGRCYLGGDEVRLNVWHSEFLIENVSTIHNHPWDFTSHVLAGRLTNRRFKQSEYGVPHKHVLIHPGMGHSKAVIQSHVEDVHLQPGKIEVYKTGETYHQLAHEVHQTSYDNGTVTINRRINRGPDRADVYWLTGEWVSAEPRIATKEEVEFLTKAALSKMDSHGP